MRFYSTRRFFARQAASRVIRRPGGVKRRSRRQGCGGGHLARRGAGLQNYVGACIDQERPLELHLDAVERRVLASLLEKEITTPDYYPLTLHALLAACNQKSNREPVMELTEDAVRAALRSLEEKGLAGVARGEGRVARFEHRMEILNLGRRESAVLCTLLLRGPQTPGELRGRSERMHRMEELDEVQLVLQKLIEHDPPLAVLLPRQPGTKESRYADRLGGEEAGLRLGCRQRCPGPVRRPAKTARRSPAWRIRARRAAGLAGGRGGRTARRSGVPAAATRRVSQSI